MENNLFFATDLLSPPDDFHQTGQFEAVNNDTETHGSKYSRKNLLISWVNSLEAQSCLLASDLDDFKNGVVFCHIVNEVILKRRKSGFQAQISAFNPSNHDIVRNFHIALTEIKENCKGIIPSLLQNATAYDFMQSDDMIITLLDFLYSVTTNQSKMEETFLARTIPPKRLQSADTNIEDTVKKTAQSYEHALPPGQNHSQQVHSNRQKPPLLPLGGSRDRAGNSAKKLSSPSHALNNFQTPTANNNANLEASKYINHLPDHTATVKPSLYKSDTNLQETGGHAYHSNLSQRPSDAGNSILINDFLDPDQNVPPYQLSSGPNLKAIKMIPSRPDPNFNRLEPTEIAGTKQAYPNQGFSGNAYQYQSLPFNKPSYHQPSPIPKSNQQSPFTLKWTPESKIGKKNTLSDIIGDLEYVSPTQASHKRSQSSRSYISDSLNKQNQPSLNAHSQSQPGTERKKQPFSRNLAFDELENQDPRGNRPEKAVSKSHQNSDNLSPYRPIQNSTITHDNDNNISLTKREDMSGFKQQGVNEAIPLKPAPSIRYQQEIPAHSNSFRKASSQKLVATQERGVSQERKRPPVVITPVDSTLKKKILEWLFSITFLKESAKGLESKLPRICRNGVIFIDLINRLEGKNDTVKGVTRHPQSKTQINVNYSKVLSYLRTIEKMNPRYLWAQDYLIEGNDDVFWGFLYDIWCLYSQKISPFDPRYQGLQNTKRLDPKSKISEADHVGSIDEDAYANYLYTNYRDTSRIIKRTSLSPKGDRSISLTQDYSAIYVDNLMAPSDSEVKSPFKRAQSPKPTELERREGAETEKLGGSRTPLGVKIHKAGVTGAGTEPQSRISISPKTSNRLYPGPLSPRPNTSDLSVQQRSIRDQKLVENTANVRSNKDIAAAVDKQEVEDWLKQMGFKSYLMRKNRPLFEDPFRNGVLLMHLVTRVENEKIPVFYSKPEIIEQCRTNVYNAFGILRRKKTPIPHSYARSEEQVLQGNYSTIWMLLYSLMKRAQDRGYKGGSIFASYSPSKSVQYESNSNILPYSEDQIKRLEASLLHWIARVGLFDDVQHAPSTFDELEGQLRNGTLLCELISLVTQTPLPSVVRKPTTENQYIENIRKGLELLRTNRNMGQKFTWKERELHSGSKHYLIGFLEDLHRLFDGLAPRTNPNYYQSGPYHGDKNDHKFVQEENKPEEVPEHVGIQTKKLASLTTRALNQSSKVDQTAPKKTVSYGKSFLESHRSFLNSGEALSTANFTIKSHNLNADEPISLLNLQKQPVNLVDFSSFSGQRDPAEPLIPQKVSQEKRWHSTQHSRSDYKPLDSSTQRYDISTMSTSRRMISQIHGSHLLAASTLRMQDSDDVTDVQEWLYSLDLVTIAEEINFAAEEIPEFSDGIALCQIVEKLEIKEIPSVILKPRTKASKLVNIRKALQILAAKQEIDPKLASRENDILEGKGATIRALLRNIKKAYRCMTKTLNASRSQFSGFGGSGKKSVERNRIMESLNDEFHVFNPYENYVLSAEERRKIIVSPKKAAY